MPPIRFVRVLRTASSERYILQHDDQDFAAVDLHFLDNHKVAATLILLPGEAVANDDVAALITEIDETLLPEQNCKSGDLMFTVVRGEAEGTFVSSAATSQST